LHYHPDSGESKAGSGRLANQARNLSRFSEEEEPMKRLLLAALLLGSWFVPQSTFADEPKDEPKKESGWVSLFDGKTLSGWEALSLSGNDEKTKWEVVDGEIVGSGEASMLYSPKGHYKNFKFRAEVKINDHGNSGMYFRTAKKPSFTEGYECQINSSHADPIRSGSIYTMVHIYKNIVPPDTYFTQEVEVTDKEYRGHMVTFIRVSINGELLYELLDHDQSFKQGHFAFQQHDPGSKVSIRKVEVMELP
jgi:hypothetical protein